MTLEEAKKIFNRHSETSNYTINGKDLCTAIDGYVFVIQTENGFNNVIFAKYSKGQKTLYTVLKLFVKFCLSNRIEYIRVEGSSNRYNFLSLMFPDCSVLKDTNNMERNIFYIRLREGDKND